MGQCAAILGRGPTRSLKNWTVASMRRQVLNAARYSDSYVETGTPGNLPQLTQNGGELGFSAIKHGAELGPCTRMHIECRVGPGSQFDLAILWVTERYVAREASFEILGDLAHLELVVRGLGADMSS